MDIFKISGILDEKRNQSEILYNNLIENIDDVFNILLERADDIKDIQLITETKNNIQTIDDVISSLTYITTQLNKHLIKYKSFYNKKNINGGGKIITWTDGPTYIKFRNFLNDLKPFIDSFKNNLPSDANDSDLKAKPEEIKPEEIKQRQKYIELTHNNKKLRFIITTSDKITTKDKNKFTIGPNTVELV